MKQKILDLIIAAKRDDPETGSFAEWLAEYLVEHGVTVHEWIPVEERLPEAEWDYLVASHNGKVDASLFFPEKELSSSYAREAVFCYPGVTHWMPLPEPPGKDVSRDG